jgi:ribonuclease HI
MSNNNVKKVIVYTDGSCTLKNISNKYKSNHGGVGVHFNKEIKLRDVSKSYTGPTITNQSMELLACLTAVEKIINYHKKMNSLWELNIYTDSMYVINSVTKWAPKWILYNWKRKVGAQWKDICHLKIIKRLYCLCKTYPVTFIHVKSHQKEPSKKDNLEKWERWSGNSKADELAGKAMKNCKEG